MIKQFFKKIIFPNTYSNERYIAYLRGNKVIIGENCVFYSPNKTTIDVRKPYLIKIGDNCKITQYVSILAHDYSIDVPRQVFGLFVGGSLPVTIGNNVFIGTKATILMGTTIGNNCIIGANSVVKGFFPDNSIIAGNPARIIGTIEDYYKKNIDNWIKNAKTVAKTIFDRAGRLPTIEEMSDGYCWLYLQKDDNTIKLYKSFFDLTGDNYDDILQKFYEFEPPYDSFESFLKDCNLEKDSRS